MSTFETYTDKAGQFRFRLKADNGEIILASEGYTTKAARDNGIESVRTNCTNAARYVHKATKAGHHFNLKAANGRVIRTSEVYSSAQAKDKGIASVRANAGKAGVVTVG